MSLQDNANISVGDLPENIVEHLTYQTLKFPFRLLPNSRKW